MTRAARPGRQFPTERDTAGYKAVLPQGKQTRDYQVIGATKQLGRQMQGIVNNSTFSTYDHEKAKDQQYYKGNGNFPIQSFKHGGLVKKTGIYKLHKGEKVLSRSQLNKQADKMFSSKYSK